MLKKLSDGLDQRKLQTVIVLKADGKTIKALTTYNEDGSYAAIGVRDSSDDFAVTIYGSGSTGVAGLAVFSGTDGTLKSEQDFNDDGTVKSSFTTGNTDGAQAKETFFDAAGNKTKEILFNSDFTMYFINEFAADDRLIVSKTSFGYSGVKSPPLNATAIRPCSSVSMSTTHINVRYFDKSGNAH